MKVWILQLLLLSPLTLAILSPKDVFEITSQLEGVPHPITIITGGSNEYNAKIHTILAQQRDFLINVKNRIITKDLISSSSIINAEQLDLSVLQKILNDTFQNRTVLKKVIGQDFPLFVLHNNSQIVEDILENPPIQIHQMIFFINLQDMTIYEGYQINGLVRRSLIGNFKTLSRPRSGSTQKWYLASSSSLLGNLISRRNNFQGLHLTVMTEAQSPFTAFDQGFMQAAKFHQINNTYEIRDFASGLFFELFKILERELNFTAHLLKRKDSGWGGKNSDWPNGWNGMISNLLDHSADMIAASLTMSQERFEVVDYLPPIGMETYTIVIKAVDSEEISWLTFKRPLRYETWIFMIAVALIFTFTIHLSAKLLVMENKNGLELLFGEFGIVCRTLWTTFTANFSGKPAVAAGKNNWPGRLLFFSCLLTGSLIWIHYRASFTSELAARKTQMPFDSLETLLNSDYTLTIREKGFSFYTFTQSQPGTIFNQLLKSKVTDYLSPLDGMRYVNESTGKTAYYYSLESLLGYKEFKCQVIPAWITRYPGVLSFALPKNSPYKSFMEHAMLRIRESGSWVLLKKRFEEEIPICKTPPKGTPLGMEKIFTLFLLVIAGAILGLMLLFVEIYVRRPAQKRKLHSLSYHPYFIATALDSVQNLQRLLKGHQQDQEGIHEKLRELHASLQTAQEKSKKMDRLK